MNRHEHSDPSSAPKRYLTELITHLAENPETNRGATDSPIIVRLRIAVDPMDSLNWLLAQNARSKTYWSERDGGFEMASIGIADELSLEPGQEYADLFRALSDRFKNSSGQSDLRYFGGFAFDPRNRDPGPLGRGRFILPRFELTSLPGGSTYMACNLVFRAGHDSIAECERALSELDAVTFDPAATGPDLQPPTHATHFPDSATWSDRVQKVLDMIDAGELEKLVLARQTRLDFDTPPEPLRIVQKLKLKNQNCFHFCFQFDHARAFLGASPERLFQREDRTLLSEAIAGTRPRGDTDAEDDNLAKDLMSSDKDNREYRYVIDAMHQILEPFCHELNVIGEPSIIKLASVQHLYYKLKGILKGQLSDADMIDALHPTPSVGGFPVHAAEGLRNIDGFDRGWYAGPVGWISPSAAGFAVAIRSALLHDSSLTLTAGAGIVRRSNPADEWAELNAKIETYMGILAGDLVGAD